jgi:cell wall-associated NlpC family hydrolase
METDLCFIPVVSACPVRAAADHRSEMTSQLLLGEPVQVLDTTIPGWLRIQSVHDGYEGWCQAIQLAQVESLGIQPIGYFCGPAGFANVNGQSIPVFPGTPVYPETIRAGGLLVSFAGLQTRQGLTPETARNNLKEAAFAYLNCPYLWGGRTPAGIDCSGFTQMAYRQVGIHLLRDASLQATEGESVGFLQEALCGDLAFFEGPAGSISHVGVLLNDHEIIHAHGKICVDDIDHQGLISRSLGKRTHQLRLIKRYL